MFSIGCTSSSCIEWSRFMELGGELKICVPCIKSRNIEESELVEGSQMTGAGALNVEAIEANAVMVY